MVECEYLKLFIAECKNDYRLNCRKSLTFCNKTMASFFYMLTCQVEYDDRVFFTSVELLNRYLICSMVKSSPSIGKDQKGLKNQYESIKEKYRQDKYIIATACFQLATQICDQPIDTSRLIEYFHELTRMDPNMTKVTTLNRDQLIQIQIQILTTIDHIFPRYTPDIFISHFLRFLNSEIKMISERLHNASMLLLVHIYLQWTLLIELLAKKESGLSKVNKIQMESVTQRFRDPLLLGSATILAASKMFCHGMNSQIHDKIISLFVSLLGIDPMRIYMAQFFAEEVIQKSVNVRLLIGSKNNATSRIIVDREHDFDDESMMIFKSP
ncbi:unnamed protein product [Rotaria magnacalcarata]|uniref:Cyclin N-terminal domain-containing protein n=1 Tax=Rotaria magnacalcarata TaxID=392030 RepID=A0A816NM03_9BILA|nr:unnamed protein product [Rotaria magnacalcarata]CAF2036677.1 unnamed protein product [Rotaria magnacalcarata]CAF2037360.1 unnamed protein product [Rotaria magnacalcarata]CAF2080603.1 unnamed protein product [Rotaria magnacalcarata]